MDLETELDRIKERYPAHDISIEWNHEGGWWGVAVSRPGNNTATVVAFGGSRVSLREAVLAVKPVEPTTVLTPTPA